MRQRGTALGAELDDQIVDVKAAAGSLGIQHSAEGRVRRVVLQQPHARCDRHTHRHHQLQPAPRGLRHVAEQAVEQHVELCHPLVRPDEVGDGELDQEVVHAAIVASHGETALREAMAVQHVDVRLEPIKLHVRGWLRFAVLAHVLAGDLDFARMHLDEVLAALLQFQGLGKAVHTRLQPSAPVLEPCHDLSDGCGEVGVGHARCLAVLRLVLRLATGWGIAACTSSGASCRR